MTNRTAGELGFAPPPECICDPMDLAALGHMTNCPCYKPIRPQQRNEISVRREASQIAQRKMWGEN